MAEPKMKFSGSTASIARAMARASARSGAPNRTAVSRVQRSVRGEAGPPRFETPNLRIQLTDAEHRREVAANERSGWSFSRKSATTQLLRYFDGDSRDKRKVYERFEDANFHNLNRALESGDPVELRRQMNDIFDNTAPNKREKDLFRRLGLNIR